MLSTNKQQQIIANLMAGYPVKANGTCLNKEYRALFQKLVSAPKERRRAVLEEMLPVAFPNNSVEVLSAITNLRPGVASNVITLADINPPPIEWLWPGWLVKGEINLLAAEPSAGKSIISLDWANSIISGRIMPDGFMPKQGKVIYVDAEGHPQVMKQRASWWGGFDQTKLIPFFAEEGHICIDLNTPYYQNKLSELVFDVSPELVIIDSFSRISSKGENSKEDVQGVLGYLQNLARTFNVTILLIHHLNKKEGGRMFKLVGMDDIRGSTHIGAVPLCIIGLSIIIEDAENINRNGPRRLDVIKNNVGGYHEPIGVNLIPNLENGGIIVQYTEDAPKPAIKTVDNDTQEREQIIIDAIRELGEEATCTKIANLVFLEKGVVSRYCLKLKERGVIDRIEGGYKNNWFVVKQKIESP